MRKRGQHIERSFAHVLDQEGIRQATLRGTLNLTKRHLAAVLVHDLSLLMRHLMPRHAEGIAGGGRKDCFVASVDEGETAGGQQRRKEAK